MLKNQPPIFCLLDESCWNELKNFVIKGIVRFSHQEMEKKIYSDCNLSTIKLYISVATSWKRKEKKEKNKWKRSNTESFDDTYFVAL